MRGVKAMLGLKDEEDREGYEEEQVGSDLTGPTLVFDDEIQEVLESENPFLHAIPKWWIAEDGTRFHFFSPTKEVELVVRDE